MAETLPESLTEAEQLKLKLAPEQITALVQGNRLVKGALSSAHNAQFAITVGEGKQAAIVVPTLDTDNETWIYTIDPNQSQSVRANTFLNVPVGATQWREIPTGSKLLIPDSARTDRQESRQHYGLVAGSADQTEFDTNKCTPVYASSAPKPGDRAEFLQGSGRVATIDPAVTSLFLVFTAEETADLREGIAAVQSQAAIQAVLSSARGSLHLPALAVETPQPKRHSKGLGIPTPLGAFKVRFALTTETPSTAN